VGVPMKVNLRKQLNAFHPKNRDSLTSVIWENPTPIGVNLTNSLLIKLLEKKGEQLHKLRKQKENTDEEGNSNLFKTLINLTCLPAIEQLIPKLLSSGSKT